MRQATDLTPSCAATACPPPRGIEPWGMWSFCTRGCALRGTIWARKRYKPRRKHFYAALPANLRNPRRQGCLLPWLSRHVHRQKADAALRHPPALSSPATPRATALNCSLTTSPLARALCLGSYIRMHDTEFPPTGMSIWRSRVAAYRCSQRPGGFDSYPRSCCRSGPQAVALHHRSPKPGPPRAGL